MIEKLDEYSVFEKSTDNPQGTALYNLMGKINEVIDKVNELSEK